MYLTCQGPALRIQNSHAVGIKPLGNKSYGIMCHFWHVAITVQKSIFYNCTSQTVFVKLGCIDCRMTTKCLPSQLFNDDLVGETMQQIKRQTATWQMSGDSYPTFQTFTMLILHQMTNCKAPNPCRIQLCGHPITICLITVSCLRTQSA